MVDGVRQTGVGMVAYWKGTRILSMRGATGPYVESYDTEMEALARGAEQVNEWLQEAGEEAAPIRNIRFYTDNTGAIHRIYKAMPGKAQACSLRFRNSVHNTLNRHPNCDITIEWVPGHQDVTGNEADREAKRGRHETITHDYRSAAFVANMQKREMAEAWKTQWGTRHTVRLPESKQADPTNPPNMTNARTPPRNILPRLPMPHRTRTHRQLLPTIFR